MRRIAQVPLLACAFALSACAAATPARSAHTSYCYAYNRGGGCPPRAPDVTMAVGLQGGPTVLVSGQVRPQVAAVELRYEDRKVERLKPVEGFVLYEIPSSHYPRGTRLEAADALDENGRVLESQQFDTHMFGIYPCDKPVDVGKGVMACP